MQHIKLQMIRKNLNDIPKHDLPAGYSFKLFEPGDEQLWANIDENGCA